MVVSEMLVVADIVSRMFIHILLGKSVCMLVRNPVARVWGQYSTSSKKIISGTEIAIYVANNTTMLLVHVWGHIREPERSMN